MSKKTIIAATAVVVVAAGAFMGHRYLTPESVPETVAPPYWIGGNLLLLEREV